MQTKDLIAKVYNSHAFIDVQNSGAKDVSEFQSIVDMAVAAKRDGLLQDVFVPISQAPGSYDQMLITGATDLGRESLGES